MNNKFPPRRSIPLDSRKKIVADAFIIHKFHYGTIGDCHVDIYLSEAEHTCELSKLKEEIERLTKYAQHLQDCSVYTAGIDDAECSCGFEDETKVNEKEK